MISTPSLIVASAPIRQRTWPVLALVLLSPAAAAIIRKLWPDQPVFIESLPIFVILFAFLWALPRARDFPSYIALPIAIWFGIQGIYTIPALMEHPVLGVASFTVRTVPLLMPIIAFAAIQSMRDYQSVALTVGIITLLALPAGLVAAFWGDDGLPFWLRSIDSFSFAGSERRAGLPALSFIFSTPAVLSTTVGANAFLAIAAIRSPDLPATWRRLFWIIAIGALLLLFLSTRRGMFLVGAIGFLSLLWGNQGKSRFSGKTIVYIFLAAIVFFLINSLGAIDETFHSSRLDFVTSINLWSRFNDIFLEFWLFWFWESPFGNYLGFAGPEANALGIRTHEAITGNVEVGAAQLLAEMGLLGTFGLPLIVAAMGRSLYSRARGTNVQDTVLTLVVFMAALFALYFLKEISILAGLWVGTLTFWATPGVCAALILQERQKPVATNESRGPLL
jgi:hypothetical protein